VSGLHDAEIATRRGVNVHTIRAHIHNIERKLGARQRAELGMLAARYGPLYRLADTGFAPDTA